MYETRPVRAFAVCLLCAAASGHAQTPENNNHESPSPASVSRQPELLRQLEALRVRLAALEQDRTADRAQIADLQSRITELQAQQPARGAGDAAAATTTTDQGNVFNPKITVFTDVLGSVSTDGSSKANNRFSLREAELDLRAAVAPWADGVLVLAIIDEVEEMPNGDISSEFVFELEEGYLNFHTLPVDGMALKAGKFRNALGRSNRLHTHDLPQVTRPLVNTAFFGPEGFSTVGASASYIVPNPWDTYFDLTAEVVNADGGDEAPILGGSNADQPAAGVHAKWFTDLGETTSFELGGSYLFTHTGRMSNSEGHVFGVDATLQWQDPEAADSHSWILQGEAFWARNDVEDPGGRFRNNSFGAYGFAQYQLSRDWYVGVRGDYTEFPDSEDRGPMDKDWAVSPYLTWYLTEFLRLRGEYQHRDLDASGATSNEGVFFLGLTHAFGSHPPHPYWVNR